MSPETGSDAGRAHLELLSWIYRVEGGRGRVALPNTRTLLASDRHRQHRQIPVTLSEENPAGVRGHVSRPVHVA